MDREVVRLHFKRYRFWYLLVVLPLFLLFLVVLGALLADVSYRLKVKKVDYQKIIEHVYELDSSLFEFDSNGQAVIKVDTLLLGVQGKDQRYWLPPSYTKELDQCVGYFLVTRIQDQLKVDSSHICDMVDG